MTPGERFSRVQIDAHSASRYRRHTREHVQRLDPVEILDGLKASEVAVLEEKGSLADRMARSSRAMTGWGSMSFHAMIPDALPCHRPA